jgi:hypothetical protein
MTLKGHWGIQWDCDYDISNDLVDSYPLNARRRTGLVGAFRFLEENLLVGGKAYTGIPDTSLNGSQHESQAHDHCLSIVTCGSIT